MKYAVLVEIRGRAPLLIGTCDAPEDADDLFFERIGPLRDDAASDGFVLGKMIVRPATEAETIGGAP